MKLDTKHLRYLTPEDWRVLTAVEIGSKNHEVVPTPLIIQLSNLRGGSGAHKCISTLAKANLIARMKNVKCMPIPLPYFLNTPPPAPTFLARFTEAKKNSLSLRELADDGYRLTYGGLDYLSLHTHQKRHILYSTGPCIGAGKESDIYICASPSASASASASNRQYVLKIHRLGRISFRSIKNNRDYLRHRSSASWMYMSRLAAQKEYAFMKALGENGFKVPEAVAWSRHTVVMGLIDGVPLRAVKQLGDPAGLYGELMEVILKLARFGLIHGDFNEFNIMIEERKPEPGKELPSVVPWIIDFPQTVSIDHADAGFYFDRDVRCIKSFFERRFHFVSSEPGPFLEDARKAASATRKEKAKRLDVEVEASGFSKKMAKELEIYMQEMGVDGGAHGENESEDSNDEASNDDNVELLVAKGVAEREQPERLHDLLFETSKVSKESLIDNRQTLTAQ